MATVDELALLSKAAYGGNNEASIPQGWTQIPIGINNNKYFEDTVNANGFAGALYYNASTNEAVIAIRGTVRRVQFFAPLKIFIRNLNNLFDSYPHHYTNQNHRLLN